MSAPRVQHTYAFYRKHAMPVGWITPEMIPHIKAVCGYPLPSDRPHARRHWVVPIRRLLQSSAGYTVAVKNLIGLQTLLGRFNLGIWFSGTDSDYALQMLPRGILLNEQDVRIRMQSRSRVANAARQLQAETERSHHVRHIHMQFLNMPLLQAVIADVATWPEVCQIVLGANLVLPDGTQIVPPNPGETSLLVQFWPVRYDHNNRVTGLTQPMIYAIDQRGGVTWQRYPGHPHVYYMPRGTYGKICPGTARMGVALLLSLNELRNWHVGTDGWPAFGVWASYAADWWQGDEGQQFLQHHGDAARYIQAPSDANSSQSLAVVLPLTLKNIVTLIAVPEVFRCGNCRRTFLRSISTPLTCHCNLSSYCQNCFSLHQRIHARILPVDPTQALPVATWLRSEYEPFNINLVDHHEFVCEWPNHQLPTEWHGNLRTADSIAVFRNISWLTLLDEEQPGYLCANHWEGLSERSTIVEQEGDAAEAVVGVERGLEAGAGSTAERPIRTSSVSHIAN